MRLQQEVTAMFGWLNKRNWESGGSVLRRRRPGRPPRRFRPLVEGLEERWTPATKTWLGTVDTNALNADNWQGGVPGVNDEAVFNGQATKDMILSATSTQTVGKLTVATTSPRN
jgi:hypothetical protein